MDPSLLKKRKADDNGTHLSIDGSSSPTLLTPDDTRKIIEPFTQDQLLDILQEAASRHLDVLESIRAIADRDPAQRKLFIRGLGWETTHEGLRNLFSSYGELDEAVVILDKNTGKSKGYGFVTFKHIDGALLALKEPSKKIDGRVTVTQLAATGTTGPTANAPPLDVSSRKIYVGNVPFEMPADRLLSHFSSYGEIEEGPLGFDKQTGKSRGFALFVYKSSDAARASLVDPMKNIDGHQMICKLAIEGKKGKPGVQGGVGQGGGGVPGDGGAGDGMGMQAPSSMPNSIGSHYGAQGGLSSYGGFGGGGHHGPQGLQHHHQHHLASSLQSSMGNPGLSSVGSQMPPSLGGSGGYGAGLGGGFGGLGSGPTGGAYGGPSAGAYGGLGAGASALYRQLPGSVGMPSAGGYPDSGHYGLSSAFAGQHHPPTGSSPVPRVPPTGMYPNLPPYF